MANIKDMQIKPTNKMIQIFIIFALIIVTSNYYDIKIIKYITSLLIIFYIFFYFIEKDLIEGIIFALLILILNIILDVSVTCIINLLWKSEIKNIFNNIYFIYSLSIFSSVILIIITKTNKTKKSVTKLIEFIKKNNNYFYLSILIIFFLLSSIIIYSFFINNVPNYYYIIFFGFCLILLMIMQFLLFQIQKINNSNNQLLELNSLYGNLLEEDKIYKHNIKNQFLTIKNYGNKKVKKLIDEYIYEIPKNTRETNNLYNVPNSIKGIVCEKLYHFKWTKVLVNNKLKNDPYYLLDSKKYRKLCEIIGISLDNATEATENLKNGYIYLNFYKEKEFYVLEIINNYKENLDIEQIGNRNYSTKKRGSGYGIYSVLKYKEIKTNFKITNYNFTTKISIKNPGVR
jgi:hypothetical protein